MASIEVRVARVEVRVLELTKQIARQLPVMSYWDERVRGLGKDLEARVVGRFNLSVLGRDWIADDVAVVQLDYDVVLIRGLALDKLPDCPRLVLL